MIITLFLFAISFVVITIRIDNLTNKVNSINDRLIKLEKDAVKITFEPVPDNVTKPADKIYKKRKAKTVKDWEEEIDLGGRD